MATWVIWTVVAIAVIGWWVRKKAPAPMSVRIDVNKEMLKDCFSFSDDMILAIDSISTSGEENPSCIIFSVFPIGMDRSLVFDDKRKCFKSFIEFEECLVGEEFENKYPEIGHSFHHRWWVAAGSNGIDIGIVTPESCRKTIIVGDKMDRIKIAEIPYSLFRLKGFSYGACDEKKVRKIAKKHGWNVDDHYWSSRRPLGMDGIELSNKYLQVEYRPV